MFIIIIHISTWLLGRLINTEKKEFNVHHLNIIFL
jgi:hypothetical protein